MTNTLQHSTTTPTHYRSQIDYIVLDGSSSMSDKWWESLAAIDSYIATLKTHNLNTQIIATEFAVENLEYEFRNTPLKDYTPLREDPVGCFNSTTPLYDAIQMMGRKMRDLNPPRASIIIVTDGDENASKFTTLVQAKAILDWCRAKGWSVTFIGCDFDNSRQARALGANAATAIGVSKAHLTDAAKTLGEKRAHHYHSGTDINFTEDERSQFGGYLTHNAT